MTTVAGVFRARESAARAMDNLRQAGLRKVSLFVPGSADLQVDALPTSNAEQPGMGRAFGGVLGGALGVAGGLELGTAAATILFPGVGPVVAIGIVAAAALGAGGAVGGAAAGAALEQDSTFGIPADELFVYKDALRQGRCVLMVYARDHGEASAVRQALAQAGAESIDAAREAWWIGLRSAEREHYQSIGGNFARDEKAYRRGFEAGLRRQDGSASAEKPDQPEGTEGEAFWRGYDRGKNWKPR